MEELLLNIADKFTTAAVLIAWVYAERKDKTATLAFYRSRLADCHDGVMRNLERHVDAEQFKT